MDVRTCFYMCDSGFEDGTLAAYGKRIKLLDANNDTTLEFSKVDGVVWESQGKQLQQAIQRGGIEHHLAYIVFNDLVRRGQLSKGDYFVRVSW
jgi:hypothetical protein